MQNVWYTEQELGDQQFPKENCGVQIETDRVTIRETEETENLCSWCNPNQENMFLFDAVTREGHARLCVTVTLVQEIWDLEGVWD
jgi:hypothetical protein